MKPRYYQTEGVESVFRDLKTHRAVGLFYATGLGKSYMAATIAKQWPGRVLFLVDRDELVSQSVEVLQRECGGIIEIEQAKRKSEHGRVVVGSVQSLCKQPRLDRLGPDAFSLVIVDEADVFVTKTRLRVINWFADAKVVSMTATPDRHDGKGLQPLAEVVSGEMNIDDGIEAGFLAPLVIGRIRIDSIDIEGIKKVRGDLQEAGLEKVMLENVGAVVEKTLELHPDRKTIFFFPGVESARLAAEHINTIYPGTAVFVDGKTDKDERREKIEGFKSGKYTRLTNCEIATRGFDCPDIALVAIARPTLSRAKHTQMCGRGTRPITGCLDGLTEEDQAAERRASIEWSAKPDCLILDYVGNTGKHKLATAIDLVGKGYTEDERKIANEALDELETDEPIDPEELLRSARTKLEARRRALAQLKFRVSATVDYISPFDALGIDLAEVNDRELKLGRMPLSPQTRSVLVSFGVPPEEIDKMSQAAGGRLVGKLFARKKRGYCTLPQLRLLKKWGVERKGIKYRQAQEAIGYLTECDFGKRQAVNVEKLTAIASGV